MWKIGTYHVMTLEITGDFIYREKKKNGEKIKCKDFKRDNSNIVNYNLRLCVLDALEKSPCVHSYNNS